MHDLLAAYDQQVRRVSNFDGVEREGRVIRILLEHWRGVLWSDLDESTADDAIAGEIERFAGLGEFEWKYYSYDTPPDLPDRLRAAGFVPEPTETLLIGDVDQLPKASTLPKGVDLREVTDEAGIADMGRVNEEGFGEPASESFGRNVLDEIRKGRTRMVIAYAGDRPVSMGRLEFYEGSEFGGLFGGATVPDWRGRGIFRAIVAQRTRVGRRARLPLPADGRLGRQPADPRAARVHPGRHDHPVHPPLMKPGQSLNPRLPARRTVR